MIKKLGGTLDGSDQDTLGEWDAQPKSPTDRAPLVLNRRMNRLSEKSGAARRDSTAASGERRGGGGLGI